MIKNINSILFLLLFVKPWSFTLLCSADHVLLINYDKYLCNSWSTRAMCIGKPLLPCLYGWYSACSFQSNSFVSQCSLYWSETFWRFSSYKATTIMTRKNAKGCTWLQKEKEPWPQTRWCINLLIQFDFWYAEIAFGAHHLSTGEAKVLNK